VGNHFLLAATRDNAGSGTGNNSQFHSSFSFEAIMINASGEKQKKCLASMFQIGQQHIQQLYNCGIETNGSHETTINQYASIRSSGNSLLIIN